MRGIHWAFLVLLGAMVLAEGLGISAVSEKSYLVFISAVLLNTWIELAEKTKEEGK